MYDNDLVVTGKLTVSMLEVTNLGIVYEVSDDSSSSGSSGSGTVSVNSDIKSYIQYVTSNVVDYRLQGVDVEKLQNMSNQIDQMVLVNHVYTVERKNDIVRLQASTHRRAVLLIVNPHDPGTKVS